MLRAIQYYTVQYVCSVLCYHEVSVLSKGLPGEQVNHSERLFQMKAFYSLNTLIVVRLCPQILTVFFFPVLFGFLIFC